MKAKTQAKETNYEILEKKLMDRGFKRIGEYSVLRSFIISGYETWVDNSTNPTTTYTLEILTNGDANLYKEIDF